MEEAENARILKNNMVAEPILRYAQDLFEVQEPEYHPRKAYPWELSLAGKYPRITKDYFRCRGSARRPQKDSQIDCTGSHSLPIVEGKEFIWPPLIDILNEIQLKTNKRVVVTCGHRCPTHNSYADPSAYNRTSKHQIGAEVDFYVEGIDARDVIPYILEHYPEQTFKRYEKDNLNVRTRPWFNQEIFVKLYEEDEGRDLDNTHPYPYISIQMRYDVEKKEWISYSWDKAFKSYYRE